MNWLNAQLNVLKAAHMKDKAPCTYCTKLMIIMALRRLQVQNLQKKHQTF